jgi:hypothetical protein
MKKAIYILLFPFMLVGIVVVSFSSGMLEFRHASDDGLSFEIYQKLSSIEGTPIFGMHAISRQLDQVPVLLKPYLSQVIRQTPRPRDGLQVKIFERTYRIYFKNEQDWRRFKKIVLNVLDSNLDNGVQKNDMIN